MRRLWTLCVLCAPLPALAQTVDCSKPQTQTEMTFCAGEMFEAADRDLNAAYGIAMDQARRFDTYGSYDPTNEALMRDAQRKWIPFRDAACSAESTLARGGTLQSQLYLMCMERLTRTRTEDLLYFGEVD